MTRLTESGLLLNNGHAKQMKMRTLSTVIAVLKSRTFPKLCALDQLGILFKASASLWAHSPTTRSSVSAQCSPSS